MGVAQGWTRAKSALRRIARRLARRPNVTRDRALVFERIYEANEWGEPTSRSGPGSSLEETAYLTLELPKLLRDLGARSLLDIPCGDFLWMKEIDLPNVRYIGADIVAAIVDNNRRFERPGRRFLRLDLTRDRLPTCDVVLVRDCLVHLSTRDALLALANVVRSGAEYLVVTSFEAWRENRDVATGGWRPLNLELPPFSLPPPLRRVRENSRDEEYPDKSLGVWAVADVGGALPFVPIASAWTLRYRVAQLAGVVRRWRLE